jgi:hypothetical protein
MRYREIHAASESNGTPRAHYWTWRSKAVPAVEFVDTVKGIELVLLQLLQSRTGSFCSSVSITFFFRCSSWSMADEKIDQSIY